MFRSLPVWLLASALAAFVGCGGGAATDSGAVAEKSNDAAPTGGGAVAMPSGGGGAAMPGGGMGAPESTGMSSPGTSEMMDTAGGAEMTAEMYGGTGTDAAAVDTAAMNMEGVGPGLEDSAIPGGVDPAAIAAAYGARTEGTPEATIGAIPGAAVAYPGGGRLGANPDGTNPAGPGGAEAYTGGEYPGAPGGGGAVAEKLPEGFDGKAQLAFRHGKERDALQYLYAHALTTDAGAESLLPTIRWVGGLKQPKLAVRWGAGFVVTAPRDFKGDPKPVGSEQTIPTRGGNRKGGGDNEGYVGGGGAADYGGGGEGGGNGGNNSLLSKGAGELGDKLAAAYKERLMRGDFGEVLKQAAEGSSGGNRGKSGGAGTPGSGVEGAAVYGVGPGAEGAATVGGGGPRGGGGGGAADAATQVTQIMPGFSVLGIGTQKELIERAREDGIDAVVIIDVKLRVNAEGLVTNESTLSLLDAKTQKKLHTTKKFNNIEIQKARAEGKEDGVDEKLENLFEAIDANFKMTDLPAGLSAEVAAKRVAAIAADKHDNPLPILAEARMYHAKGLLDESALFAAYEQILGVDFGRLLATGEEEDKKKVLNQWLPES